MGFDYNEIYNFCKVRNNGTATSNGIEEKPPRVKFILNLLERLGIKYHVESFSTTRFGKTTFHNIYLYGSSNKWLMAHHDVCNHNIDNANDNSCSVMNAIALKTLRPDMNIALVDGEEPPCMGSGSSYFAEQVNDGDITIDWVLNLELTGKGGENFFIGNYDTSFTRKIEQKFNCAVWDTPFNDASILARHHINVALINPCPIASYWEVKQVGVVNDKNDKSNVDERRELYNRLDNLYRELRDLEHEDFYRDREKKIYDEILKLEDRMREIEMDTDYNNGSFFDLSYFQKRDIKVGDKLTDNEYREILNRINNDELPEDQKFISIQGKPNIEGRMPTIKEMDTSILNYNHNENDHVGNIDPNDMKIFVEKVLIEICNL